MILSVVCKPNELDNLFPIPMFPPKTIHFVDSNPHISPHPPLYSPSLHSNPVVPIYLMRREPISYFVISFCKMAHWQTRPLKNVANPQKLRRKLARVASIPKASLGGLTVNYIFPRCFLTKVTVMMKKMILRVRTQFRKTLHAKEQRSLRWKLCYYYMSTSRFQQLPWRLSLDRYEEQKDCIRFR